MANKEFLNKCMEHKHALIFAAGIATAIVGKKVLESRTVKNAATRGMANVMAAKRDAEETFQDMKENAEEIMLDAHEEDKKEIYVEAKE
jgi:hypothetical protein